LKIKLDEQLSQQLKAIFIKKGHEVSTVYDQDMIGKPDEELWPVVQEAGQLLVTADKEFADIRKYPPGNHNGVILLRPAYESLPIFKRLIKSLLESTKLEDLKGKTAVLSESGTRIRTF
jgi:predicted nuclease of predicted toxin-antitoxin system